MRMGSPNVSASSLPTPGPRQWPISKSAHHKRMQANRRLLFWLRVPYAADVALVVIGVVLLLTGRDSGWSVLIFAGLRAVIGTFALLVLAPRIIALRSGTPRE